MTKYLNHAKPSLTADDDVYKGQKHVHRSI